MTHCDLSFPLRETAGLDSLIDALRSADDDSMRVVTADHLHVELDVLVHRAPTASVRARLFRLLREGTLDQFLDSRDFPSRAALVRALSVKESWALELDSADRQLLKAAIA